MDLIAAPQMTRAEWDAACEVYECRWHDHVWAPDAPRIIGEVSGRFRVRTPDGADRPATGDTPAEACASVAYAYDDYLAIRAARVARQRAAAQQPAA